MGKEIKQIYLFKFINFLLFPHYPVLAGAHSGAGGLSWGRPEEKNAPCRFAQG